MTAANHLVRFITVAKQLLDRTIYDLTRPLFVKQMAWVFAFGAFAVFTIKLNMNYLNSHYPVAARPDDFFLDRIPEMDILIPISDFLGRLGSLIIIYIMWQERFRRVPKLIFLLATMYMLRGFAILLTPLEQIQPPAETYAESNFLAQNFYYGMFFSGHTASAFIQVFFIKRHPLRPLVTILAIFQVASLVASHSHYSIDIFGGFFVAYFITHFDFMYFVPKSLRDVTWMPWHTSGKPSKSKHQTKRLPA